MLSMMSAAFLRRKTIEDQTQYRELIESMYRIRGVPGTPVGTGICRLVITDKGR